MYSMVETEANGDLRSTNEKGSFLGWFVVKRDFFLALAALVSPVQNIFFLTAHFLLYVSPSPSN